MKRELIEVNRNDPCPCGSGKKAKDCCMGKDKKSSGVLWKIVLGLLLVTILVALTMNTGRSTTNQSGSSALGTTPEPWFYDRANNRHWHAEHGHWHDGPPPASSGATPGSISPILDVQPTTQPSFLQPSSTEPTETPEPWEYDPVTNRHWHAEHGHWHDGPPPDQPNQ